MTTLTATPLEDVAGVRLDIAAAPTYGSPYVAGFATAGSVDGWTASAGVTWSDAGSSGHSGPGYLIPTAGVGISAPVTLSRVVTGLTVGVQYQLSAWLFLSMAKGQVGVAGKGATSYITRGTPAEWVQCIYRFTATATSHTIQATFLAVTGTQYPRLDDVAVDVISTAGDTTIVRVDANGSRLVRLRSGQEPIGGSMSVVDYEAALVGPIRYDLTDSAGALVSASTSLDGLVDLPQLHTATMPQNRAQLVAVTGYSAQRSSGAPVHEVIGRPDPVVTGGPFRKRRGRLDVWCQDYAAARELEQLAELAEVLCFRQPTHPGMDMYIHASATSTEPDAHRWKVSLEYVELAFPSGPLLGSAGWSFADVVAAGGTFAELPTEWPSFAALAVGP